MAYKIPVSVLVVIHTPALQILLIERARNPGFWQSVTGSLDAVDESPLEAAVREVGEETGLDARDPTYHLRDWKQSSRYEIFPEWRARYAPDVTTNLEHVFSLEIPAAVEVVLSPREHTAQQWLGATDAAAKAFSPSNRAAILQLGDRLRGL